MQSQAQDPDQYIKELPEERKEAMMKLRKAVLGNIPKGFQERMGYGMLGYCIPHSLYPAGYHCDPKQPLPFAGIASQKNFIAFYHMGVYADPKLLKWFQTEYPKHTDAKLDMGKSCIRFTKPEKIPFKLLGDLMSKISAEKWIEIYETTIAKSKTGKAKLEKAKAKAAPAKKLVKKVAKKIAQKK